MVSMRSSSEGEGVVDDDGDGSARGNDETPKSEAGQDCYLQL